jgi:type I restriction enzyme S subunit
MLSKQNTPSVLFHELVAARDMWLPFEAEGTVFGAINKQQLADIEIPALDTESARDLEEILRPLDQRVMSACDENQALSALRDALLPRLMSGEVRVRDAEKVVEDVT